MPTLPQALTRQLSELNPQTQILVGYSGGLDSQVLLHLLCQCWPLSQITALHVHHGLNPLADQWLLQCQGWAQAYGVQFIAERVFVNRDEGIEQGARAARYQAFAEHLGPDHLLLTAHHQNDQAETFLLAMKRGSGPRGLSAMPRLQSFSCGAHLRPLLSVTRQQLEAYAKAQQLDWLEDDSNDDCHYDRNFIRHRVLKPLAARWPSVYDTISRSAALCAQQEQALQLLLQPLYAPLLHQDGSLCIEGLAKHPEVIRTQLLRLWLSERAAQQPSLAQFDKIWQEIACARVDANPQLKIGQGQIRRYQQRLYWLALQQDVSEWSALWSNLSASCVLPDALGTLSLEKWQPEVSTKSLLSVRAPLAHESVTVCFAPKEMHIRPLGRGGSRHLKKLYQEYGIPSWQRPRMPLLYFGETLIAIAGLLVTEAGAGDELQLNWQR
ncbi:tRNA(Ile)-lysidine synthase [Vibrio stylophorae]|uniref:tRNA(Ile)-lysidine synthase n=1 Tax=Vibrio stylophorae TaxID=659351 RepID=A0ABM8ZV68_9VIBR|nr:tRNA lysidine(34) synthetase TilS [Vibrio stylophorae]CAH0534219.1 tRNA(Ile)-lysidine synthase [Vibrio stylophorae]